MVPPSQPSPQKTAKQFVDEYKVASKLDNNQLKTEAAADLATKDLSYVNEVSGLMVDQNIQKTKLKEAIKERVSTATSERLNELKLNTNINTQLNTLDLRMKAIEKESNRIYQLFPDLKPKPKGFAETAINKVTTVAKTILGPIAASGTFMGEMASNLIDYMNDNSFMNNAKQYFWSMVSSMDIPFLKKGAAEKVQMHTALGTIGSIVKEETQASSQNNITFDYRMNPVAYKKIIRKEEQKRQLALPVGKKTRIRLTVEEVQDLFANITYDFISKQRQIDAKNGTEAQPIVVSLGSLEHPDAALAKKEAATKTRLETKYPGVDISFAATASTKKTGGKWALVVDRGDLDTANNDIKAGTSSATLANAIKVIPHASEIAVNQPETSVERGGKISVAKNTMDIAKLKSIYDGLQAKNTILKLKIEENAIGLTATNARYSGSTGPNKGNLDVAPAATNVVANTIVQLSTAIENNFHKAGLYKETNNTWTAA